MYETEWREMRSVFVGEEARMDSQFSFCHDRNTGIGFPVGAEIPPKRR
jgi:hypothetical protein